jgi:hypothetical protein
MKPTQWTSTHQGLSNGIKSVTLSQHGLEDLNVTNKTKKQPSFIVHRCR